ncbi:hypothetical protein PoB_002181200 [Plakobranchus ocellatus]|uniref:Uncharacterized protein n=1 Tax=Plakobranchus ocellatus TaxID=259542 RepID=A0AAV3ZL33_9GAST|nr:hypothetical protein PoB_002181200 [Plakobranchus ocellatus]
MNFACSFAVSERSRPDTLPGRHPTRDRGSWCRPTTLYSDRDSNQDNILGFPVKPELTVSHGDASLIWHGDRGGCAYNQCRSSGARHQPFDI